MIARLDLSSFPARLRGYRERIGALDVVEYRRRSKVRPYGLRMECQVDAKQAASRCHTEALQLARDLNITWAYVAVVPLFPKRLTLQIARSPDGWCTNLSKLKLMRRVKVQSAPSSSSPAGPAVSGSMKIKLTRGKYEVKLPYMPLQRALGAVKAYRSASESMRLLINLYFGALDQPGTETQLFLLAKALELARDMLPGHEKSKKAAALPDGVRGELVQSLNWLGKMSNERLDQTCRQQGQALGKTVSCGTKGFHSRCGFGHSWGCGEEGIEAIWPS